MSYILWAAFAMVSYSLVFLFGKLAMRQLPAFTVMTVSVFFVLVISTLVTLVTGEWRVSSYVSRSALYMYAAGLTLTGAVVGYFRALATGPASVVVPIYGMFIVGGSILGIVFLNEPVTVQKLFGIGLAAVSVILIAS
jgi:transporter family protein